MVNWPKILLVFSSVVNQCFLALEQPTLVWRVLRAPTEEQNQKQGTGT